MPLEAIAINDLNTPLIKKPTQENELKQRLQALYEQSDDFATGEQAIDAIQQGFASGSCLYVGMFNDKPICAVSCLPNTVNNASQLDYLIMHPQNKNRGIELAFLRQVSRLEEELSSENQNIQQYLQQLRV